MTKITSYLLFILFVFYLQVPLANAQIARTGVSAAIPDPRDRARQEPISVAASMAGACDRRSLALIPRSH